MKQLDLFLTVQQQQALESTRAFLKMVEVDEVSVKSKSKHYGVQKKEKQTARPS